MTPLVVIRQLLLAGLIVGLASGTCRAAEPAHRAAASNNQAESRPESMPGSTLPTELSRMGRWFSAWLNPGFYAAIFSEFARAGITWRDMVAKPQLLTPARGGSFPVVPPAAEIGPHVDGADGAGTFVKPVLTLPSSSNNGEMPVPGDGAWGVIPAAKITTQY